MFGAGGIAAYPSRYLWGGGTSPTNCGFATQAELLANKQAVWHVVQLQGNKFAITNASNGTEECLVFSASGTATYPSRYLWGGGTTSTYCGLGSLSAELSNEQAVWMITPLL